MGFNLSSLSPFTKEVSDNLIQKTVLTGDTAEIFTVIPGIKYKQKLNYPTTTTTIQLDSCGLGASGSVAFTQREITVSSLAFYDTYCLSDLEPYWLGQIMAPGAPKDVEPNIGNVLAEEFIKDIKVANEMNIWQGVYGSTSTSYNKFDGICTILGSTSAGAGCVQGSTATPTAANIDTVLFDMVAATSEDIVLNDGVYIFLSPALFVAAIKRFKDLSLYLDKDVNSGAGSFILPGYPNITVKATKGLKGTTKIVLMEGKNGVIGTDLMNEEEQFYMAYDPVSDKVPVRIKWKMGTQVFFPSQCVINWAQA